MNVVLLSGNLARDPEMRYTPTGKAVTEFTIAVNEGTGDKRVTYFIDCQAWEKTAEIVAEQARKGTRVVVEGGLLVDSWTDKESGKKRKIVRVRCRAVNVVAQQAKPEHKEPDEFGDLPF